MRKVLVLAFALLLTLLCVVDAARAAGPGQLQKQPEPTEQDILQLANKYIGWCEPKLKDQDRVAVQQVRKTIEDSRFSEIIFKTAIENLISQLTLKLTAAKSLNGLTVSAATVLKEAPKNRRALNLFGSVLHTYDKDKDAITVFRYALSLDPGNPTLRLNLANSYLDDDQDEKAKGILDKLEFDDPNNTGVYRALATYWYKRNNVSKFREYLFKAAKFKGFKRRKADKQKQVVESNDVDAGENAAVMEAKLKVLEKIVPLTTADIVEQEFPAAAQQIRDKYGKLGVNEKWVLPRLPDINLNGPYDYERNGPITGEWAESALEKFKKFPLEQAKRSGVDPGASDKVKEAQGKAAAKKQMEEALQQAQQAIKYMENVPGVSKADIAKAKAELEKVMREQGVKPSEKPVDLAGPPPGMDSGSLFAEENYYNYIIISTSYEKYFLKYFREYNAKTGDIYKRAQQDVQKEMERFEPEWEKLQDEGHRPEKWTDEELKRGELSGPSNLKDHGEHDEPCRRAMIQHKQRMNLIFSKYYAQWQSLYFPEYAQKMKPTLDAYWNVCMLHIRNMNDPEVIEREYNRVTFTYMTYATQAISAIGGGGFGYYPEVEEEQFQLEQEILRAKEEAEAKKPEFERAFQSPEFSWTDWINDKFALELSGQFLALKLTARSIEFQAYVPGITAGVKYDFTDEKFESYTAAGGKLNVGVNVCGVGVKIEAGAEAWRRTATWDLKNGKYYETDTGKVEATGSLGSLQIGGEVELDAQLNAKYTSKASLGRFSVQEENQFK